jgi:hypothetical protein
LFESLHSEIRKSASTEPGHIPYEQLEAFVDDGLETLDRDNVQAHLNNCPLCKAEEQDLRSFQSELVQKTAAKPVIPFWRPLFLRIAAAAAMIAFVVWISEFLTQSRQLQSRTNEKKETLLVTLNDGNRRIELDQHGNLTGLPGLPSSYKQKIASALTRQQADIPLSMADLIGKSETLQGASERSNRFSLISPVGTVVQSDRPLFQWSPLMGADAYRVYIYDEHYNEISVSPLLKETAWTVPRPLERGANYNWQVTAMEGRNEFLSRVPPEPEPKFQILSKEGFAELERIKRTGGNSHLVTGISYAEFGLLDDAERELSLLSQENPQSQVARKLLNSVQSVRRNSGH